MTRAFPNGYGEENDYCFRAVDAGFSLVVATHTYVFHAKSRSYPDWERLVLVKAGGEALRRLHGPDRVDRAVRSMQRNPMLENLRQHARSLVQVGPSSRPTQDTETPDAGNPTLSVAKGRSTR